MNGDSESEAHCNLSSAIAAEAVLYQMTEGDDCVALENLACVFFDSPICSLIVNAYILFISYMIVYPDLLWVGLVCCN